MSAVLFGSAAEGGSGLHLHNLLLVLQTFSPENIVQLREAFLAAEAAIKLRVMFVLEEELHSAAELFAQKFADILRRHRIVFGKDVLATLKVRGKLSFSVATNPPQLVVRLRGVAASGADIGPNKRRSSWSMVRPATGRERHPAGARRCAEIADSTAALAAVAASFGPQTGGGSPAGRGPRRG